MSLWKTFKLLVDNQHNQVFHNSVFDSENFCLNPNQFSENDSSSKMQLERKWTGVDKH